MDLTPELLRAYSETRYTVIVGPSTISFRLGEPVPALDAFLAQRGVWTAGFITAWNPLSERRPIGENKAAQKRLQQAIGDLGLPCYEGAGQDENDPPTWLEPSLLAVGIRIDQLIGLATEYRQHASIWIEHGKPPELIPTPIARQAAVG
jgi:hypothetical protein